MSDKKSRVVSIGLHGTGRSIRSNINLRIENGIHYLEIQDSESGTNRRIAKIAISPDNMIRLGAAMVCIGEGGELNDIDHDGFNRVSQACL